MKLHVFRDVNDIPHSVFDYLSKDDRRHHLAIYLLHILKEKPQIYPDKFMWAVTATGNDDVVVLFAMQTPPYPALVCHPKEDQALRLLAKHLVDTKWTPIGFAGALPEAKDLQNIYCEELGRTLKLDKEVKEAIHVLEGEPKVGERAPPPGAPHRCTVEDEDTLTEWYKNFANELDLVQYPDEHIRTIVRTKVDGEAGDMFLWRLPETNEETAWVGSMYAAKDVRIGPVMTKKEHRGKGYARALLVFVLQIVRRERPDANIFLFTDLSNPTSNSLYRSIGFQRLLNTTRIVFENESE